MDVPPAATARGLLTSTVELIISSRLLVVVVTSALGSIISCTFSTMPMMSVWAIERCRTAARHNLSISRR